MGASLQDSRALQRAHGAMRVLLPSKTPGAYATARNAIRAQAGEAPSDTARLLDIDFEMAAINAAASAFPRLTSAWRYFHLSQSVYRQMQQQGIRWEYPYVPKFKCRAQMLSAIAAAPVEDAAAVFETMVPIFGNDGKGILA